LQAISKCPQMLCQTFDRQTSAPAGAQTYVFTSYIAVCQMGQKTCSCVVVLVYDVRKTLSTNVCCAERTLSKCRRGPAAHPAYHTKPPPPSPHCLDGKLEKTAPRLCGALHHLKGCAKKTGDPVNQYSGGCGHVPGSTIYWQ